MTKNYKKATLSLVLALTITGCAHTQNAERDDKSHRTRNVLIAVGTTVAVGVLLGKKAQSNSRDAIRDSVQPE